MGGQADTTSYGGQRACLVVDSAAEKGTRSASAANANRGMGIVNT